MDITSTWSATNEGFDPVLDMLSTSDSGKVNVFIGDERESKFASNSAFIFRPLTVDGKVIGAIGVFGPSRMDYSKVISTVEYLTKSLSGDAVAGLLGEATTLE